MKPNWKAITFGDFATLQRGADLPIQNRRTGKYPIIASNGVVGFHEAFISQGPGVVTGRSGTIGKPTYIDGPFWPLNTVLWVSDFHKNNPRFVYFFFKFFDFLQYSTGATVPTLNRNFVHPVLINIPQQTEQEKVAAVLWKIQRGIEIEEKLIGAALELKQSAMHQFFKHGMRGEAHHDTELGPLPKNWRAVPLGSFGRIGNGSTPLKTNPAYWTKGTIPWLTSAKVYDVTVTKADQFVTPLAVAECHLPRVKAGSVLMAITGQGKTLGHAAVTAIETCVSQHVAFVAFTDDSANPHFIRLFLESRYAELRSVASGGGSTKGALTCGFLKTFLVPQPERNEQDEIASALMTIEAKISIHERRRAALSDLFQTLLHQLMTAEIRVDKLDIDTNEVAALSQQS